MRACEGKRTSERERECVCVYIDAREHTYRQASFIFTFLTNLSVFLGSTLPLDSTLNSPVYERECVCEGESV